MVTVFLFPSHHEFWSSQEKNDDSRSVINRWRTWAKSPNNRKLQPSTRGPEYCLKQSTLFGHFARFDGFVNHNAVHCIDKTATHLYNQPDTRSPTTRSDLPTFLTLPRSEIPRAPNLNNRVIYIRR